VSVDRGLVWRVLGAPTQVVLWNRYDLVGAFRIADDGSARPLEIPGLPDA
jgi:hypothetical protein